MNTGFDRRIIIALAAGLLAWCSEFDAAGVNEGADTSGVHKETDAKITGKLGTTSRCKIKGGRNYLYCDYKYEIQTEKKRIKQPLVCFCGVIQARKAARWVLMGSDNEQKVIGNPRPSDLSMKRPEVATKTVRNTTVTELRGDAYPGLGRTTLLVWRIEL